MHRKVIAIVMVLYVLKIRQIVAKSMELQCDECRFNPKHFNIFNLSIVDNNIYAEVGTKTKITFGFKFYVDIELRLQKSKKYNSVFKTNLDICRVIMSFRNNIYKKWLDSVLQYGNFSPTCPITPSYYYLHGWKLDDDLIPAFMFSGDYRIQLHGYYGRFETPTEDMFVHCVFNVKLT